MVRRVKYLGVFVGVDCVLSRGLSVVHSSNVKRAEAHPEIQVGVCRIGTLIDVSIASLHRLRYACVSVRDLQFNLSKN